MDRAVFLDRDGTLIVDRDYLRDPEKIELLPGVLEGLLGLKASGFKLIVVTNQSGVARGYFTETEVRRVNLRLASILQEFGAEPDAIYYCPAHPEAVRERYRNDLDCRKPAPGMLLRASAEQQLDLGRSFIIGDKLSDVEAGHRAGCISLLLLTGYGPTELEKLADPAASIDYVAKDFSAAVDWIINQAGTLSGEM